MDQALVLYCLIAGLFLLCFRTTFIKLFNPFYGSRLKSVVTCKNRSGETIYIFRWRPNARKDDTPVWEMGKCNIVFISDRDLKDQVDNPKLPKGHSISTWNGNQVTTLDVNYVLPHEVYVNHRIPNSSIDFYAGIRLCRANVSEAPNQIASAAEIKAG